jgi:integrase
VQADTPIETVAESYFDSLENPPAGEKPLEPGTVSGYRSIWRNNSLRYIRGKAVASIDDEDYKAIYNKAQEFEKSATTRNEALRLLEATLKYAKLTGMVSFAVPNPIKVKKTRAERQGEKADSEKKFYTPDEIYTMIHAADSLANDKNKQIAKVWQRYRAMLHMLIYTGARISEVRAFPRDEWKPTSKWVWIKHSAPEGKGSDLAKATDSIRKVPMNPALVPIMNEWLSLHDLSLVFGTENDTPISRSNLYKRMLDPLKDRCDLLVESRADARFVKVRRDRKFHAFRHHYAAWLVSAGANVKQLQSYMGHATASFTLDVYAHLFEDDGADLVLKMKV